MIILTLNEIRNGWTEVALKRYRKEMERDSYDMIYDQRSPKKRNEQNHRYKPFKWRR